MYTIQHVSRDVSRPVKTEKETIHSGHFMVSHFEAEEQDDEDNVAVPIPETTETTKTIVPLVPIRPKNTQNQEDSQKNQQQLAIDTSLAKLFQCMSLAYRQKLTSPKWNRFRGIRLRWKDKIRLNNVIWRCWHLQFIKKEHTLVCQFASPLDVDTHNKPEAVVLEGKYWKRKLAAVTAEYKRWRMFYRNNVLGHMPRDTSDMLQDVDLFMWNSNSSENVSMMVDEDYMGLMSDTLFSTITNQPYVFPDSREIARAGLADFIQPSLGPLQPNLDDYMDIDPFQELMNSRLPTVPEEAQGAQQQSLSWGYLENSIPDQNQELGVPNLTSATPINQFQMPIPMQLQKQEPVTDTQQTDLIAPTYNNYLPQSVNQMQQPVTQYIQQSLEQAPASYPSSISKTTVKALKNVVTTRGKAPNLVYSKSLDNVYTNYGTQSMTVQQVDRMLDNTRVQPSTIQVTDLQQYKLIQAQPQQSQQEQRQGYKFQAPSTPNIKFTTPQQVQHPHVMQSYSSISHYGSPAHPDIKVEPKRRGAPRGRGRSRSNTREPVKRPPLISTVSDPALITPQTSVLLTRLLTNNSNDTNILYSQSRTLSQEMISNSISIKKEEGSSVTILPQAQSTALIIPAQLSITAQPSTSDPLLLNTFSNSNSPIMDPLSQNIHSPTSSQGSVGSPGADGSHRDRRVGHIHAEQKRRYNIKNGFDMIHSLIPHLNQNPNAKLSKAAMLQKGAEYIRQLKAERNQLKEEMESLKQQIETLNTSISNCQSMLPATGAPVSRRRDSKMQEMFDEYVRTRTMENWKFWIFSLICRPLLNSFNNFVSTSSLDDLYSSTMHWVEQHCTLVDLRPVVLNSLRYLCTKTEILSDPDRLPDEARDIALGSSSSTSQSCHNQNN